MSEAREYARALFLLTEEEGTTEAVRADAEIMSSAIRENPDYLKLLDTPAIPLEEKLGLIDKAFSTLNTSLLNLCKLLCEKRCASLTERVADEYFALYDRSRGIERVEAVTAVALTEAQLSALSARLEKKTGKTVIITNTVDKSILGGIIVETGDSVLDGSLTRKLRDVKEVIKA